MIIPELVDFLDIVVRAGNKDATEPTVPSG
jgi:hypothetical protein